VPAIEEKLSKQDIRNDQKQHTTNNKQQTTTNRCREVAMVTRVCVVISPAADTAEGGLGFQISSLPYPGRK
jgi:hypothetical protein